MRGRRRAHVGRGLLAGGAERRLRRRRVGRNRRGRRHGFQRVLMAGEALAPKDVAQPDEGKTPVFGEVATIADERDITRGYIGQDYLYPQDRLLQAKGGDIAVYEEILSDDQVMACLQQRRRAVVSREWEVEPGGTSRADRKAADFLREQLKAQRWDAVTELAHFGVYYGYMVAELVYARDGAQIALDAIKVRKQKRFRFDLTGRPRLRTMAQDGGEALPPRKFWHFSTGADNSDEPYGLGLAHWLYWPVWFKKNDLKLWLQAIDKFSVPTSVGRYGPNASPADKAMLLQAGRSIRSSATVIVPKEMELAFMEAQRSGVSDNAALFDRMQGIIAKVIVGQTMTTDNGSSRSQAEVHMDVRQDIVKADADLICESFNLGPARWLTEWNFPGAAPPRVWRRVEDAPDLKAIAERDGAIARLGYKPTLAY
ncbi:MAG: DUF935 family protein, partial [Desulfobulbaceae bacterium]